MDSIIHAPEMDLPASLNEVDANCVYAAFEKITDGRCKRGIRYPVALILTLIVLARVDGRAETEWSLAMGATARDVALMDFLHVPNVPNQMRFYQAHPLEALRLLLVTL